MKDIVDHGCPSVKEAFGFGADSEVNKVAYFEAIQDE
jgi:hypothetical protein